MNHKVNILMVDDEPANLLALEATLECLGQNLVKVNSGADALRCLLEKDFAVILLDVQMAGMSGIETAAEIRARERSRHIPIIFLTGVVKTEEMMFKGYSTGAVDYLMKPIVTGILRAKVEVFVELAIARLKLQEEVAERARIAAEISKLNMALEQRNDDLSALNSDLEAFCHTVSHDLRAPLRHIQGYVGFLDDSATSKLDDRERSHVAKITDAAKRMGQLIDDLLGFSRMGRVEIHKGQVKMDVLVRETIDQLQPDLAGRKIEWNVRPLPEVLGDHNLLRQVWSNLIGNAVKYTRPRDPTRIEIGAVIQDGETIFHIRDNGVGFSMEYSEKLFGVFQRLHDAADFEGTGIGLANVRRIVQRHGGRTWAESKEGEGATFYFSLPSGDGPRLRPRIKGAPGERSNH
ncbi:MAG TPA: ATP-binding protein [Verrucomicrobiae bacterium]|jgi:two-component system sensor histidine kinase/response regulator|nr:ATP-binding protein [Verrucomicrobiae bacterium]